MKRVLCGLAIVATLAASPALATQTKQVTDNSEVQVTLSSVELSRITAPGDRIRQINFDAGLFAYKNDEQTGDIWLQVQAGKADPKRNVPPASFYVITEKGFTYKLLATFKSVPSEQIVLMNPMAIGQKAADQWERKSPYQEAVIRLIQAMVNGDIVRGYDTAFEEKVIERGDLRVVSVGTYTGSNLEGEEFFVQNTTSTPMRIDVKAFQRRRIAAVYVEHTDIAPGASTRVWVVARRGEGAASHVR